MNTPAQDIRLILEEASGLGLVFATDLFIGLMPDYPDLCVSLTDTPGIEPGVGPYYYNSLHVLVRGGVGEYDEAVQLAVDIASVLHEYHGWPDSSSYYYAGIWQQSEPFFIGVDEKNRPLFSTNYRIQRR